ncbi:hypothetical protein EJ02DRAFT_408919, partial [Clathrospora elynae]
MTLTKLVTPSIACAENISLLYLLHPVPTLPSRNPVDRLPLRKQGYGLCIDKERSLVSVLAFLSNAHDDANYVPALCVQEEPATLTLNVFLAVNKSTKNDGSQILLELKRGFDGIFATLAQISEEEHRSPRVKDEIFSAIVVMCSHRILRRLRLVEHKRYVSKQPIQEVLREVIGALKEAGKRGLGKHSSLSTSFMDKAKDVLKLADAWAKHQTTARLEDLVKGVYRLKHLGDIKALIESIPNRSMCPSARSNLYNIICKVSRYHEVARFLYRMSKRNHVLQRMRLTIVDLPKDSYDRHRVDPYTPILLTTIMRSNAKGRKPDLGHVCRLLKTTEVQANEQFASQTKRTLRESKVHAEIQLIYYCDLNASKLPPRVISSSKDACYLCNAFITMHGKMHISRSHGRLYPGWRLPQIPELHGMQQRFNSVLEKQVRSSLSALL